MDKNRLRSLFERLDQNTLSQHDIDELDNWYHDLNAGDADLKKWFAKAGGEEVLATHLYTAFGKRLRKQRANLMLRRVLQAAAVLLVVCGAGLFFYLKTDESQHLSTRNKPVRINPATKNARLTLSNGSTVDVGDLAVGTTNLAGAKLEKTIDGRLIYKIDESTASAQTKYNTISTPRAGQFEIILPDGTHVWLNAASSLKFPLRFVGAERQVTLKGEGYFEVARNKKMPFKVESGIQTVTVLGTHFNIKAYEGEENISTTLFEGSVSLKNNQSAKQEILKPGKQADISINKSDILVSNADLDQAISWKNGYFIFDNQDIKSIMTLISRWYDVDVEYHISSQERFGGTFSRSSDLQELLKNLESLGKTRFQLKERRVIVSN